MEEKFKNPKWATALKFGDLKCHCYLDEIYYNIDKHGNERYWKDGKLHKVDGPAAIWSDGAVQYCINGLLHREKGPAYIEKSSKSWYIKGNLHRLDGPAIEFCNGYKAWYIEGKEYTEREFNQKVKIMEFEKDPKWQLALSCGELKHYKDQVYYNVNEYGDKHYWKDGKLHRDDGPAIERSDGTKYWLKDGMFHRLNSPAVESANGDKWWYKEDKLHREDGPAVENKNGDKQWFIENKRHRLDGPAIEWVNGRKWWYIEEKEYTEEEFNQKVKIMEFQKDPKWAYALILGELKHYKNDIYYNVNKHGHKTYWKDGLIHRDDGPALERSDGPKVWYKDGKLHREDGPAYEGVNGTKEWFLNGKRHRLDGPAIELKDGNKSWYIEGVQYTEEEFKEKIKMMEFEKDPKWKTALSYGELEYYKDEIYYNVDKDGKRFWKNGIGHRDDGPAIEWKDGSKYWFKEGKLHRLDGPAREWADGDKQWFIDGKEYTEQEYIEKIKQTQLEQTCKLENKDTSLSFPLTILTVAALAGSIMKKQEIKSDILKVQKQLKTKNNF